MDIILLSHSRDRTWRISRQFQRVLLGIPVVAALGLAVLGFVLGRATAGGRADMVMPSTLLAQWTNEVEEQRVALDDTRTEARQNSAALARRIAQLQARVVRLDAAGERLVEVAGLDQGEFNFSAEPPLGGPEAVAQESTDFGDIFASLSGFEQKLNDRERQLKVLEDLLLSSRTQQASRPSGMPVAKGWISSGFGYRADPFNGRRAMHRGVDFAAASGDRVLSVGPGLVTEAGPRDGFGILVEINHGNGYVTRYGHNKKVLVKPGQEVARGQVLGLVGSTGRSTGPHVHFEVLYNGKQVNPVAYLKAAR